MRRKLISESDSEHPERPKKLRKWEVSGHTVDVTPGWTVIHPDWDIDWIYKIMALEIEKDRAICGYKTRQGTPCTSHPSEEVDGEDFDDVGRCSIHKRDAIEARADHSYDIVETSVKTVVANRDSWLKDNPAFKSLVAVADSIFAGCEACQMKLKCKMYASNSTCKIEKDLFYDVFSELVVENALNDTIDKMFTFSLVTNFVQIIRSMLYEKEYGTVRALQAGMVTLRLRLTQQMMQLANRMGIDRKSRILINHGGARTVAQSTLSEILSGMDANIQIETLTATKTHVKRIGPPLPRGDRKFIDLDGTEIIRGDYSGDDNI